MVFDITYILNLRTKYTKIDLPNDFTLFLEEYVRKQGDLKRNQYSHTHNTNKQSKVYYKSHKQNKVQRIIIRNNNAWYPTTHSTAKNIINIIKSNLNKLTHNNFSTISNTIVSEIVTSDINIINVLCDEIISKNTYDKDFQDEYIKLCHRIWNMKMYTSFTEILHCESTNKYYCKINTSTQSSDPSKYTYEYIGPYNSSSELISYIEREYSFKRILLNRLYDIFKGRFSVYGEITGDLKDEIVYKKKREISSVIEFICKLYLQELIPFNTIYLLHIELMTFQLEQLDYKKYDIELLYTIWGILKNSNRQKYNIEFISNIYNIFHFIIEPFVNSNNMTPRIKFFVTNIQDTIKTKFRCVYNQLSIKQFEMLIDSRFSKSHSGDDTSGDDTSGDDTSGDDTSGEESEIDCNSEDNIIKCLNSKGDLYKLITDNNINEYVEVLVFITINNIKYLTDSLEVLSRLEIKKEELDNLTTYDKSDLDEFALDNRKVYDNYETFRAGYNLL